MHTRRFGQAERANSMKKKFISHSGVAAPIMIDNIDTDQIIPSREMKLVSRKGLGDGLFAGWRYVSPDSRQPNMDFVLNRPAMVNASILISGKNFGCGSSREHAVWALQEYGIRVIIAKSFGEIFQANCLRNGLLAITLSENEVDKLAEIAFDSEVSADLEAQTIRATSLPNWTGLFKIEFYLKRLLSEGLCTIDMTLKDEAIIDAFFASDSAERPWIYSKKHF